MEKNKIRWLYLALGTVVLLFAGIIYGWSILKAPLAEEFGWSASGLSLNFTLTMCSFCFGGMFGGFLIKKFGLKISCFFSAALSFLGFFLASNLKGNIIALYLSYGALAGFGIGAAYNAIISTVSAWFIDKKGLCSGILMMGFGASSLLLGNAANFIIVSPALGWRMAFRIIGACLGLTLIIAGIVLKRPETSSVISDVAASAYGLTSKEMIRSATFYKAFILIVFLSAVGSTVISTARDLALSVRVSAATATTMVGILSLCNGLGRIATGFFFDKFGRRNTMLTANILTIFAALTLLISVTFGVPALCIFGLCLTGMSYGTCPTITSAFVSEVFGPAHFSENFPIMNCNILFASFIATGTSLITAATNTYTGAFILLSVLTVLALMLNISIKD